MKTSIYFFFFLFSLGFLCLLLCLPPLGNLLACGKHLVNIYVMKQWHFQKLVRNFSKGKKTKRLQSYVKRKLESFWKLGCQGWTQQAVTQEYAWSTEPLVRNAFYKILFILKCFTQHSLICLNFIFSICIPISGRTSFLCFPSSKRVILDSHQLCDD